MNTTSQDDSGPARLEPRPTDTPRPTNTSRPADAPGPDETGLPNRRKPADGVHIELGRPNIVFVTVCTKDRRPWLACEEAHRLLVQIWRQADAWLVGPYVLMPDHLHLFAAPRFDGSAGASPCRAASSNPNDGRATLPRSQDHPYITIERWLQYWKSQFSKAHRHEDWAWQTKAFHHRLRRDENYSQKWLYVRENPVRAGLVTDVETWRYQGEVYELRW